MMHHFVQAPDHYFFERAILWAQTHELNGDARLVEAILGTRIGTALDNDDFGVSVIRVLIANPLLDRRHRGPIVDDVHAQQFRYQDIVIRPGVVGRNPPPQPNLSMRGRTAVWASGRARRGGDGVPSPICGVALARIGSASPSFSRLAAERFSAR